MLTPPQAGEASPTPCVNCGLGREILHFASLRSIQNDSRNGFPARLTGSIAPGKRGRAGGYFLMPAFLIKLATVSDGCAPTLSQY